MNNAKVKAIIGEILEQSKALQAKAMALSDAIDGAEPTQPDIPVPSTNVIKVKPGDNVEAALDSLVKTGGTILAYPGQYKIQGVGRERPISAPPITITTDTTNLPRDGQMITREYRPGLAEFLTIGKDARGEIVPTWANEYRARNYIFRGVCFGPSPEYSDRTLIELGGDKTTLKNLEDVAEQFIFDRVLFMGDPELGQHRAITTHAKGVTGMGCAFYDFFEQGRDSQAIAGWNGAINHAWTNCLFEGGAENVMAGGADSAIAALMAANWLFRGCTFSKPLDRWKKLKAWAGMTVKCLLEMKAIDGLLIDGCILDGSIAKSWSNGAGMTLKCANQDAKAPWSVTRNVQIRDVVMRNMGTPIVIVGYGDDGKVTQRMSNVEIRNVLAYDLHPNNALGESKGPMISNPPDGLTIDHLTMIQNRNLAANWWTDQQQPRGTEGNWTNSIQWEATYGIKADGPLSSNTLGYQAWIEGFTKATLAGCAFVRGGSGRNFKWNTDPTNQTIDESAALKSFDDHYRVKDGSALAGVKTTDGKRVGADVDLLMQKVGDFI